jgi:hypothetical protein
MVLDSAIISLILAHRYLGDENWWKKTDILYKLSGGPYDYDRRFHYFDQIVMNATFLFVFNSFEHSVRLICKQYNPDLYQEQKRTINGMCKKIRKDLDTKQRDDFIDLVTYLRNSFHNNGLFLPGGELKDRNIPWNGTIYYFRENQRIKDSKGDMWLSLIPICREIIIIFNETINSVRVKKFTYYPDPTEPIR